MKLFVYHAEHRCAPCRDMHARIDVAIKNFAAKTGLDASGLVEYVNTDKYPGAAPYGMKVVPTLVVESSKGSYFRSDGRCSIEERVEGIFSFISKKVDLPKAEGEVAATPIDEEFKHEVLPAPSSSIAPTPAATKTAAARATRRWSSA